MGAVFTFDFPMYYDEINVLYRYTRNAIKLILAKPKLLAKNTLFRRIRGSKGISDVNTKSQMIYFTVRKGA